MSMNNSSKNNSLLSEEKNNNDNDENSPDLDKNLNKIYFNSISKENHSKKTERKHRHKDHNNNENISEIINSFLSKLFNNDSILVIDKNNIKEIFSTFKKIVLSEENGCSGSIVMNIDKFEIKYDTKISSDINDNENSKDINEKIDDANDINENDDKCNDINGGGDSDSDDNVNENESSDMKKCKTESEIIKEKIVFGKRNKDIKGLGTEQNNINQTVDDKNYASKKKIYLNRLSENENQKEKTQKTHPLIIKKSYSFNNKLINPFLFDFDLESDISEEKYNHKSFSYEFKNLLNLADKNNNKSSHFKEHNNTKTKTNSSLKKNSNNMNSNNSTNANINSNNNHKQFKSKIKIIKNLNKNKNFDKIIEDIDEPGNLPNKDEIINNYSNKQNEQSRQEEIKYNNMINSKVEIKVNKLKNSQNNNAKESSSTLLPSSSKKEQLITQKIKELNMETIKFKEERNKITNLKDEYEKLQKQLIEDIEEFEVKKEEFEKYKQYEMDKIKKKKLNESKSNIHNNSININNNPKPNTLNSKKDKEVIKLLKGQVKDLENVIKLKDDELKIYGKTKNTSSILKYNNGNNNNTKIYNNNLSKKIFLPLKQNLDQVYSEKNIIFNSIEKNKGNKFFFSNDLSKINNNSNVNNISNNFIKNSINYNNNTINANSSKNYFENINKNLTKEQIEKFLNISYTNNKPIQNNLMKNSNTNNNHPKNKSKVNASFQLNTKISNMNSKKNIFNSDVKEFNKKLIFQKEKKVSKKGVQKIKLDFKPKFNEIMEIKDDFGGINGNNGYIIDDELDLSNSLFLREKDENKKKLSKNNVKTGNTLNKKNHSNHIKSKNEFNFKPLKNKISIVKTIKNNFNINCKMKNNTNSVQKKNKNKIANKNISNSATKNIKRIKKKADGSANNINENKNEEKNNRNNRNNNLFDVFNLNSNISNDNSSDRTEMNINKENNFEFIVPDKYKSKEKYKLIKTIKNEGKTINIYNNNKKEIIFKSGVKKEIFSDGYQLVHFPNGDKKQTFPGGKIVYYFSEAKTVQTSFKDGLNVFKFNNNQIEKHYPDGSKFIIFPNGTKRRISKNGNEETIFPDGKIQKSYIKKDNNKYDTDENFLGDSIDGLESNENKNVFMSYLDIDQNDIDE